MSKENEPSIVTNLSLFLHQEARSNITLTVRSPVIPFLDIETIDMYEREIFHLDLDWGYDKNGSVWYDHFGPENFIKRSGNKVILTPFDGDGGEYILNVSYGLLNTTDNPVQKIKLIVRRNLSTIWFKVELAWAHGTSPTTFHAP